MTDGSHLTDQGFNFVLNGTRYRGYQNGTVEVRRGEEWETLSWDEGMKRLLDPAVEWVDRRG